VKLGDYLMAFNRDVSSLLGEPIETFSEKAAMDHAGRRASTLHALKADRTVISVVEEGLPPGWSKIIRRSQTGDKRVFFKSPSTACIE
jgi:hypothetical protein